MIFTTKEMARIASKVTNKKKIPLSYISNWRGADLLTTSIGDGINRRQRYTAIHLLELTVLAHFTQSFRGASSYFPPVKRWLWENGVTWLRSQSRHDVLVVTPSGCLLANKDKAALYISEAVMTLFLDIATICEKIREVAPRAFEDFEANQRTESLPPSTLCNL